MAHRTSYRASSAGSLRQLNLPWLFNGSSILRGQRCVHTTPTLRTDGVFRGLADTRLPMPWIQALRAQKDGKSTGHSETSQKERDLTPKKMSDSYHRIILPLAQDPWLSDTYINSSGHIR